MIKACKWCGEKQEMTGKREFCPGERCKNAWKYAKRTGKLKKGEEVKAKPPQGSIDRPPYMNDQAAAYWDRVAPTVIERGHLNVLSTDAFAELCDLYSRLADINTMINLGTVQKCDGCGAETVIPGNRALLQVDDKWDNKGGVETRAFKESALSDLKRKYSKLFLDYCRQFYLTPLSNRGNFGLENNGKESPREEKDKERFF